ncbi:isochorismatase family protein [Spiroplasma endosymbiont of Amphibalanus improvisus]|uniref:isochorismatase family protein n=1 Tax=Spiroplasma endosymbiont of Amphibalanus improvisus TaxID=3066327 RepID=UPI00313D3F80
MNKKAIIVVDYQYDFVDPKGSLYVNESEKIKEYIIKLLENNPDYIKIATRDWHPIDHCSFTRWKPHCIQNTLGAQLMIPTNLFDKIIDKGIFQDADSYSGFYDEKGRDNGLDQYLKNHNVKDVVIVGVALDVCVSATFKDAIKLNYNASIDLNGTKGIQFKI